MKLKNLILPLMLMPVAGHAVDVQYMGEGKADVSHRSSDNILSQHGEFTRLCIRGVCADLPPLVKGELGVNFNTISIEGVSLGAQKSFDVRQGALLGNYDLNKDGKVTDDEIHFLYPLMGSQVAVEDVHAEVLGVLEVTSIEMVCSGLSENEIPCTELVLGSAI